MFLPRSIVIIALLAAIPALGCEHAAATKVRWDARSCIAPKFSSYSSRGTATPYCKRRQLQTSHSYSHQPPATSQPVLNCRISSATSHKGPPATPAASSDSIPKLQFHQPQFSLSDSLVMRNWHLASGLACAKI